MNSDSSSINPEESKNLQLQFQKRDGFLPVAVQDSSSGEILMIASVNPEAFAYSLKNKKAAFWSTSRNELWVKGLTSGNTLYVNEILVDCDQDALIYKVTPEGGGACHTRDQSGEHRKSCFYRKVNPEKKKLEFI